MKRYLVLAVGVVFLFSTVAFAADQGGKAKGKKEKVMETAPAASAAPEASTESAMAPDKAAAEKKETKKKATRRVGKVKKAKKPVEEPK